MNELVMPPADSHCLLLNLATPLRLSAHFEKRRFEGEVRAGEVAIIPADSTWTCRSQSSHSSRVLLLYFRPLFIRSAVPNFSDSVIVLTPQIGFRNNQIRHLAMSLMQELNEANIVGRFYADSLAIGLAMQLFRRYSSMPDVRLGRGGMAPHKLRKALGMIDHHLADEGRMALSVVAREVGMSYFHFSRAFKQSMGMSPSYYVVERRIERAKELLNETELPISEIALRSGFSSQSHFTTSFRRVAGVTPKDFRAAI
jgi:AraC family transcriptional regulator